MQKFTYSIFWKFIYRFGNVVVTAFLSVYVFTLAFRLDKSPMYILPFAISLFLIYYINKAYFNYYKLVPYKIEVDDEKIVCSEFIFRNKTVTIFYKDIESLSGGIFNGRLRGIMKICDAKNKMCIGFFDRMIDVNKLITIILSKVDRKIYDEVLENMKSVKIRPDEKKK